MVNLDIMVNWGANAGALQAVNSQVQQLSSNIQKTGNSLGFMAFQWTFMAGIARRSLEEIKVLTDEVLVKGASAQDAVIKAVELTVGMTPGLKNTALMADMVTTAIYKLGSGQTIFGIQDVAKTFQDLGMITGNVKLSLSLLEPTLKLMTLNSLDAADAGGKVATMWKDWGAQIGDVNKLVDMLQQGTIGAKLNFDQLTSSLAIVDAQAKQFHLSLGQTIELLRESVDVDNKTLQALGGLTAAGGVLSGMFTALTTHTDSAMKTLGRFGVETVYSGGQIKPFTEILDSLRGKWEKMSDINKVALGEAFGFTGDKLQVLNKFLTTTNDEFNANVDVINKSIAAQQAYQNILNDSQSSLARIGNATDALKLSIVAGLAPALNEMANSMNVLVGDEKVQGMFKEIGTSIGQALVPVLQVTVQLLHELADIFAANKGIVDFLSVALLGLVGMLVMMLIIGTIAGLVAALGSLLQKTLTIAALNTTVAFWQLALVLVLTLATIGFLQKGIQGLLDVINGKNANIQASSFYLGMAALSGILLGFVSKNIIGSIVASLTAGFLGVDTAFLAEAIALWIENGLIAALPIVAGLGLGVALGNAISKALGLGTIDDVAKYIQDKITYAFSGRNLIDGIIAVLFESSDDPSGGAAIKAVHAIADNIANAFRTVGLIDAAISDWFVKSVGKASSMLTELGKTIAYYMTYHMGDFFTAALDFATWVINAITSEGSKLVQAGKDMGAQIVKGIEDAFSNLNLGDLLGGLGKFFGGLNPFPNAYGCTGTCCMPGSKGTKPGQSNTKGSQSGDSQHNQLLAQQDTVLIQMNKDLQRTATLLEQIIADITITNVNIPKYNNIIAMLTTMGVIQTGLIGTQSTDIILFSQILETLTSTLIVQNQLDLIYNDLLRQINAFLDGPFTQALTNLTGEIIIVTNELAHVEVMLQQLEAAIAAAIARLNSIGRGGGGSSAHAFGGIISTRTTLLGEGGPEAVIPLAQLSNILGLQPSSSGKEGAQTITISAPISITIENGSTMDVKALAEQLSKQIANSVPDKLLLRRNT